MKPKVEHTGLTVGGNLVDYPGDVSTKTADLTTAKILFNSVLSTPGAKFMGIDLKNFYLNTPLERYEYMRLPIDITPEEITKNTTCFRLSITAMSIWKFGRACMDCRNPEC